MDFVQNCKLSCCLYVQYNIQVLLTCCLKFCNNVSSYYYFVDAAWNCCESRLPTIRRCLSSSLGNGIRAVQHSAQKRSVMPSIIATSVVVCAVLIFGDGVLAFTVLKSRCSLTRSSGQLIQAYCYSEKKRRFHRYISFSTGKFMNENFN